MFINIIATQISIHCRVGSELSAYILQEIFQHTREHKKKAYVAFLMPRKHSTQCGKLFHKGIHMRTWHLVCNTSSCSVTWNHAISTSFPIHQGVRQGAILSPLLHSIFVHELLDLLTTSGLGETTDTIQCGVPMYADDLALVADSPAELQAMLNIV